MIDHETVQRIIDTADIVDVVSDFVTLKRRGANYVGLCPFHNDRNPSFYVSRAKGYCKCFSCGKGGSAVGFIMEHEQLSYQEALRYLARKYHIEIVEREMTDEERQRQSEREAMLMVNEWACKFFEQQLHDTDAGREIGMTYFRERGFGDEVIKRFRLGYSPEDRSALYKAAVSAGFNRQLLFDVGLCIDDEKGGGYDRFRGRVMFPILNVAGKIVAFGGRTMRKDMAKYVNSPESLIYNKRNELYGLYQAKRAIGSKDKCFIVEGYADVISMHQAGFENVIASSGTALTEGHIHLIHRFTNNITELFDGDAAGVHAAMRGVDMLLAQGMNIKILVLPDDDDPDSFSRKHTSTEVQRYIDENETDFIRFKSQQLLAGAENDPVKRVAAITEVVKSIAVIPQPIARQVYAKECAVLFGMDEKMILGEIRKYVLAKRDDDYKRRERERLRSEVQPSTDTPPAGGTATTDDRNADNPGGAVSPTPTTARHTSATTVSPIERCERDVIHLVAKYGMCYLCDTIYEGETTPSPTTVVEFVYNEMYADSMQFTGATFSAIFSIALDHLPRFYDDLAEFEQSVDSTLNAEAEAAIAAIDVTGHNAESLAGEETKIRSQFKIKRDKMVRDYRQNYLEKLLCSYDDDAVRNLAYDLVTERYQLSKIHSQYTAVEDDLVRLKNQVQSAINVWKLAMVSARADRLRQMISSVGIEEGMRLMEELSSLKQLLGVLSKASGERVVVPRRYK